MNTITNKKGNTGYTVAPWNFHIGQRHVNGVDKPAASIDLCKHGLAGGFREDRTSVDYYICHVKVHSCGKKRMVLECIDEGCENEFRGRNFDPATKIFATLEDAQAFAQAEYERVLPLLVEDQLHSADRTEIYYREQKWCTRQVADYREAASKLEAGEYPLRLVYPYAK